LANQPNQFINPEWNVQKSFLTKVLFGFSMKVSLDKKSIKLMQHFAVNKKSCQYYPKRFCSFCSTFAEMCYSQQQWCQAIT